MNFIIDLIVFFVCSNLICTSMSITSQRSLRERRSEESVSPLEDYIFSLPDIITNYNNVRNNKIRLTAFKTRYNDAIIKSKSHDDYGQLRWVSLGNPNLLPFQDTNQYFELNNQYLFAQVSMLTDEHVSLIKSAIQKQYRQLEPSSIDDNQIVDMPLTDFKCKLKLDCSNIVLNGEVKNFGEFPLILSFKIDKFSNFKTCIQANLFNQTLMHTLECQVSQKVKLGKTNILTIDADQQTKIELINEIFGSADTKYVTRNQLDELASTFISNFNVYEDYEFDYEKDTNYIRDEILKQTSIEMFKSLPIKEALESLSSFNINKDLSPDIITSELGKILKVVKNDSKEHIKLEQEELIKLLTRIKENKGGGGNLNLGLFKIGGFGNKDIETSIQNDFSKKSLIDQLVEINSDEANDFTFEQKGEKILPKDLKVAKLSKALFNKKLAFKEIRKKLEKTIFQKKFDLIAHKQQKECLKTVSCKKLNDYEDLAKKRYENGKADGYQNGKTDGYKQCKEEYILRTTTSTTTTTTTAITTKHSGQKFHYNSEIRSDGLTNFGDWGAPQFCPHPHHAIGYNTKIEESLGKGDDTALNSIKLICSDQSVIYSSAGPWGVWGNDVFCKSGEKFSAFAMKSEPDQGNGDDTAANGVKLYCSSRELSNHHEAPWGRWGNLIRCPDSTYICGLKTQVEGSQGKGDDTALNNVIFYCCA